MKYGRNLTRPKERRVYTDEDVDEDDLEGKRKFCVIEKLVSNKYLASFVKEVRGEDLTVRYFQEHGFTMPLFIREKSGLGMRMPGHNFKINDVKQCVGSRRQLDVMDVNTQKGLEMSMKDWVRYYENPGRERLLNVISLEFSHTRLENYVEPPDIVRHLDWVENAWPRFHKDSQTECTNIIEKMKYPKVQKYCLMSVRNCYTDFHIDMGGTSVWYHLLHGAKSFWVIPPTEQNLQLYENWVLSGKQSDIFFADKVDKCQRIEVQAGNTLFIPTGWIHAVYTSEDSLVFGGNFLHSLNMPMQIRIHEVEDKTKVPQKFRYPFFQEIHWYLLDQYVNCLTGKSYRVKSEEELVEDADERRRTVGDDVTDEISLRCNEEDDCSSLSRSPDEDGTQSNSPRPLYSKSPQSPTRSTSPRPPFGNIRKTYDVENAVPKSPKGARSPRTSESPTPVSGRRPDGMPFKDQIIRRPDQSPGRKLDLNDFSMKKRAEEIKTYFNQSELIKPVSVKLENCMLPSGDNRRLLEGGCGPMNAAGLILPASVMSVSGCATPARTGPWTHLTRWELKGLRVLVNWLDNLPPNKRVLPKDIHNYEPLLRDINRLLEDHSLDDMRASISGDMVLKQPPRKGKKVRQLTYTPRAVKGARKARGPGKLKVKDTEREREREEKERVREEEKEREREEEEREREREEQKERVREEQEREERLREEEEKEKEREDEEKEKEREEDDKEKEREEHEKEQEREEKDRDMEREDEKDKEKDTAAIRRRRVRCKVCEACTRGDCRECHFCCDMKKYGGAGKMKQSCKSRQCMMPVLPTSAVCSVCGKDERIKMEGIPEPVTSLMECGICWDIVHPPCIGSVEPDLPPSDGVVNEDLPNSWECPRCCGDRKHGQKPRPMKGAFLKHRTDRVDSFSESEHEDNVSPSHEPHSYSPNTPKRSKKHELDDGCGSPWGGRRPHDSPPIRKKGRSREDGHGTSARGQRTPQMKGRVNSWGRERIRRPGRPPTAGPSYQSDSSEFSELEDEEDLHTDYSSKDGSPLRIRDRVPSPMMDYDTSSIDGASVSGRKRKDPFGCKPVAAAPVKQTKVALQRYIVRPAPLPMPPKFVKMITGANHALDQEIWMLVFQYLPPADLCACLRVCRTWNRWCIDRRLWSFINLSRRRITRDVLVGTVRRQPTHLDVSWTNLNRKQLEWLASRLPQLKHLSLAGNSWAAVCALCCSSCPLLYSLDMKWVSGIRDACMKDLISPPTDHRPGVDDSVSRLHRLTKLEIAGSDITDSTLKIMTQFMPRLEMLDLSYCTKITNDGMKILTVDSAPTRNLLTSLDLTGCNMLTDTCFSYLRNLRSIQYLSLEACPSVTVGACHNFASHMVPHLNMVVKYEKYIEVDQ